MKSKVLFTKEISTSGLVKIYEALGKKLNGKVAVKLHSGEEGNQNYLRPEFVRELIHRVNGTVVECNTAYIGASIAIEIKILPLVSSNIRRDLLNSFFLMLMLIFLLLASNNSCSNCTWSNSRTRVCGSPLVCKVYCQVIGINVTNSNC